MKRDVKEVQYHEGEWLYDNQELCDILKISMRSLQRYRSCGGLQSIRMKRITYYKHSEVEAEFNRGRYIVPHVRRITFPVGAYIHYDGRIYELTKNIAPNNVSSISMRDYEVSMKWAYQ